MTQWTRFPAENYFARGIVPTIEFAVTVTYHFGRGIVCYNIHSFFFVTCKHRTLCSNPSNPSVSVINNHQLFVREVGQPYRLSICPFRSLFFRPRLRSVRTPCFLQRFRQTSGKPAASPALAIDGQAGSRSCPITTNLAPLRLPTWRIMMRMTRPPSRAPRKLPVRPNDRSKIPLSAKSFAMNSATRATPAIRLPHCVVRIRRSSQRQGRIP